MKRRILTLCLVLALVVSMALPAFATPATGGGTHTYNGTDYKYYTMAKYNSTQVIATLEYGSVALQLKCVAKSTVYCESEYFYATDTTYGHSKVSATAGNTINHYGTMTDGTVVGGTGSYYIGNSSKGYLNAGHE